MSETILWETSINNYQCKCVDIGNLLGKLTVVDSGNNTILEKELVLVEPLGYEQWEAFCRAAIN